MTYFGYILATHRDGALYVGSCKDLRRRVEQHRAGAVDAHTKKYSIHTLVYFEPHETLESALTREKLLKKWRRAWKMQLIESVNPDWCDLVGEIPL